MIRACDKKDIPIIQAIINDGAQAYKGVIPDDCWHEPYMPLDELRREVKDGVKFWGWEEDGKLVGVMGLQDVKDVTLIRHAYIRTAARSKGIGGKLLEYLKGKATRPILIGTWAAATWAIGFYEKHGFRLVSTAERDKLLPKYWRAPQRQFDSSVVLVEVEKANKAHEGH
ncbi:MAG: GNAT family N-acetyltransferase [Candidatus Margulisbacteria bacterium]|nr:GNAT family N-acetyltransferase [Candidatus Margulisiibacteriota bacterium]